ncbi:MAG: hypothetical protein ACI9YB_002049, partial [Halioglobus sp.]
NATPLALQKNFTFHLLQIEIAVRSEVRTSQKIIHHHLKLHPYFGSAFKGPCCTIPPPSSPRTEMRGFKLLAPLCVLGELGG